MVAVGHERHFGSAANCACKIRSGAHVFGGELWQERGIAPLQPKAKNKAQGQCPNNAEQNGPPQAQNQPPHFGREIQTQCGTNDPLTHIAQIT